ncbi:hypothetical protein I4F81_006404 [Pyropia yezoensis]|uniref:Uncharacterized protein n=1 Tax=Pyropia yezoensis TaxID=2788 RepID=A0ACC3C0X6_PYRYE|nr:hypothetical protein I4F81_006404 [Neopyropia yezoensis]
MAATRPRCGRTRTAAVGAKPARPPAGLRGTAEGRAWGSHGWPPAGRRQARKRTVTGHAEGRWLPRPDSRRARRSATRRSSHRRQRGPPTVDDGVRDSPAAHRPPPRLWWTHRGRHLPPAGRPAQRASTGGGREGGRGRGGGGGAGGGGVARAAVTGEAPRPCARRFLGPVAPPPSLFPRRTPLPSPRHASCQPYEHRHARRCLVVPPCPPAGGRDRSTRGGGPAFPPSCDS